MSIFQKISFKVQNLFLPEVCPFHSFLTVTKNKTS